MITHDQKQYNGIVVGLDKDTDLAVIKIEAEGLIPAEFGDDNALSVGETVVAIGNPGGVQYSGSMKMCIRDRIMAACRLNLPSIFVSGGPMLPGKHKDTRFGL